MLPLLVPVLYLAIPAYNEVATIGVLLWRLRTVLAEFPREYEVVVYDDASTDDTAMVAEQYERAMPVTLVRGRSHLGYAGATDALLRHVAGLTRYPRRDAVLLLQGDFTDPPGIVPEFARRFEGGADLVVGERMGVSDAPTAVKRLYRGVQWAMRPFVRVDGVKDLTASMRLVRVSALRDAIRDAGNGALVQGDSWTANADLLLRLVPHARRVEAVPVEPSYGVRMRETRRVALRDALAALKWAWGAKGRKAVAGSSTEAGSDGERRGGRASGGGGGRQAARRSEEPELSVERLRDRVRETRGTEAEPEEGRRGRDGRSRGRDRDRDRDRSKDGREREGREGRRDGREARKTEATERPERRPRGERLPRGERPARPDRPERPAARTPVRELPSVPDVSELPVDALLELDDPFAAPQPRKDPIARVLDRSVNSAPSTTDGAEGTPPAAHPETGDDASADDDEGADSTAEATAEGDASDRPRRRRRNRRSRRGRGRSDETSRRENGDGESSDEAPADHRGDDAADDARDQARDDADDNGSDSSADEGADDTLGDDPAAAPRRPRGRRGRRGGARRSRGRRQSGGAGDDGGAEAPPPSAPDGD